MHTKPKTIWGGILFPYTFGQIRQFWVPGPNNRIRTVNKVNSEIEN